MTDPQAAREQAAREWFSARKITPYGGDIESIVALLAAQRAAVLEEVSGRTDKLTGIQPHQHCESCNLLSLGVQQLCAWLQEQRP